MPSCAYAPTSFHNIAAKTLVAARTLSKHGCMPCRNMDIVNVQHPPWWENTSTVIPQRRIEVCLEKVVNNTENGKYSENEKYSSFT